MKITENQLKQIIDEEIQAMVESGEIDEGFLGRMAARGKSALSKAGSAVTGAGQSLGAKYAGAKAAGVSALGGGAKDLRQQQADLEKAAAATKAQGAEKAEATKTLSILNSHLKAMVNDLTKLGIDLNQPGVKGAVANLQKAVSGSIAKKAGTNPLADTAAKVADAATSTGMVGAAKHLAKKVGG